MTPTKRSFGILALLAGSILLPVPATSQVAQSGYTLPLKLAIEAAAEAIRFCEAGGYKVSATVVDASGVVKLQAKGDHSTRGAEIVAALGVGGAPGGEKDEACAEAGVAMIRDHVASAPAGNFASPGK